MKPIDDPPLTVLDYLELARSALWVANESYVRAAKTGTTLEQKRVNADMSSAIDVVDELRRRIGVPTLCKHIDASMIELPPNSGTKRVIRRYSGRYEAPSCVII